MYIDNATKDGIINHYKTISKHRTAEGLEVIKIEKLFDFEFPIYKVEYVKEFFDKNYVFIDYVQVVNENLFDSLEKKSSANSNDFEFYKINNFDKLISKCKNDEKCVQSYLGEFDTSSNISYEKVKF